MDLDVAFVLDIASRPYNLGGRQETEAAET
jgi:hypothetical protein